MTTLGVRAFDQDPAGGWRALAAKPGCKEDAADLIAIYRDYTQQRLTGLAWHEGQLRAELGQTEEAIALMEQGRHPAVMFGSDQGDWNAYVDATIAFLKRDHSALIEARERLAHFPVPAGYSYIGKDGSRLSGRPPNWPYNLDVVDALVRCFGKPYKIAYGSPECRSTPR
jgi:hypothetical protein